MTGIEGRLDGPVPVKFGGKVIGEATLTADERGVRAQITLDGSPAAVQAADAVRQDTARLAFTFIATPAAPAIPDTLLDSWTSSPD